MALVKMIFNIWTLLMFTQIFMIKNVSNISPPKYEKHDICYCVLKRTRWFFVYI